MPDNRSIQIMKAISMFDPDEDYTDKEARDKLAILFRELVMSNEPKAKEFLERFLDGVDTIISDMGIIDKPEEEPSDDVEMPSDDEELPSDDEEFPADEEPSTEEIPEEPTQEPEEEEDVVSDELLGAGYTYNQRLVENANGFLNY